MKRIIFLFLIGVIALIVSCNKENPEPEHKDVFRCKVNGELWKPAGGDGFWGFDKELFVYYEQEFLNSLYISAKRRLSSPESVDQILLLQVNLTDSIVGKYSFRYNYYFTDYVKGESYYLDTLFNNYIAISDIDSLEKIISGEFQFKGIAHEIKDTVLITEGEFSVKY